MKINKFFKMSGSGNDFIIVDNMKGEKKPTAAYIEKLCRRGTGIGADGMIFIEKPSSGYDFKMVYFNSDGHEADMCGNGGRAIVLYAYLNKIVSRKNMVFQSRKGIHKGLITGKNRVKIQLSPAHSKKENITIKTSSGFYTGSFINTGVPHFVIYIENVNNVDVKSVGREIRFSENFKEAGTNVNFVMKKGKELIIRTYERGVEDETLACGTGSVAAAILLSGRLKIAQPIVLRTKSDELLKVYFNEDFSDLYLEGMVTPVYSGINLL